MLHLGGFSFAWMMQFWMALKANCLELATCKLFSSWQRKYGERQHGTLSISFMEENKPVGPSRPQISSWCWNTKEILQEGKQFYWAFQLLETLCVFFCERQKLWRYSWVAWVKSISRIKQLFLVWCLEMREAVIECYWSWSCEVCFSLSFSWLFLNGSSRASNDRGKFLFCLYTLLSQSIVFQ